MFVAYIVKVEHHNVMLCVQSHYIMIHALDMYIMATAARQIALVIQYE